MIPPSWINLPVPVIPESGLQQARARQANLTKPRGSLGMLEEAAVRLAAIQRTDYPRLDRVKIVVFAADHGIARAGVSAFPQEVTLQMVRNFLAGGAAISVLARHLGTMLEVVDVGVATDPGPLPGLIRNRVAPGTEDFRFQPAMTDMQVFDAMKAGQEAVERAKKAGCQLFIGGEMGIGNTTSATAIVCALLGTPPEAITGPGTGVDLAGMKRKVEAIQQALDQHQRFLTNPLSVLLYLGGFEIAALTGAYIAAAQAGIPCLVDGFISSAAALVTVTLRPQILPWLFFAHRSAEPGQTTIFKALKVAPYLQLDLRLGEGSGAAVALPLLRLACALHGEMATFQDAGVSNRPS